MTNKREDLVFGLVGGLGTDLRSVSELASDLLRTYGYIPHEITLSALLDYVELGKKESAYKSEQARRLDIYMTKGDTLREMASEICGKDLGCAAVSLLALNEIKTRRTQNCSNAFILKSLKHPSEIQLLRSVYRDSFFCISVFSSQGSRVKYLEKSREISSDEAKELLKRDEDDEFNDYGQKTRSTFELGDLFFSEEDTTYQYQLDRFLRLVFGAPDITPTSDEHSMYLAYAASMRSADLSRQVGATIVSRNLDVLATGANDVPKSGGGQYWPGDHDVRDIAKGYDTNELERVKIAEDIYDTIFGMLKETVSREKFLQKLEKTSLFDITEYGRAVHAEMEAILLCARNGVSTVGSTLFCTTYPCHNCAKHIVDAGIERVVFVEAYPKSQAFKLHNDAIESSLKNGTPEQESIHRKTLFEPFTGIGPRRYLDLFSMKLGSGSATKRKKDGKLIDWHQKNAIPRVPSSENTLDLEEEFLKRSGLEAVFFDKK